MEQNKVSKRKKSISGQEEENWKLNPILQKKSRIVEKSERVKEELHNPKIEENIKIIWETKENGKRGRKIKIRIISDEKLEGGTKRRGFFELIKQNGEIEEYMVMGSSQGLGTLALVMVCSSFEKKCIVLNQHPKEECDNPTVNSIKAQQHDNIIVWQLHGQKPAGGFSGIVAEKQKYVDLVNINSDLIRCLASSLGRALINIIPPNRVWITVGVGNLLFSLMEIWKESIFHAVVVNKSNVYRKSNDSWILKKKFEKNNIIFHVVEDDYQLGFHDEVSSEIFKRIPFKCLKNYDAKIYLYEKELNNLDLIWNVGYL